MAWKRFEGGLGGFSADVRHAWNVTKATNSLADEIRCALCLSSIRSASTNIHVSLLCSAVECRLMSSREALNFASSVNDEYLVSALPRLASHLSESLLEEALSRAFGIDGEERQAQAMVALAPYLSASLSLDCFLAARALKSEHRRASIFLALTSRFPKNLIPEMLDAIERLADENWRAGALVAIAARIPETSIETAAEMCVTFREEHLRASCIVAIIPHLPEVLRSPLIASASEIVREEIFVETMVRISDHLHATMLGSILFRARHVSEPTLRARLITALIPRLPAEIQEDAVREALEAAQSIESPRCRAASLTQLARVLNEKPRKSIYEKALIAAGTISLASDMVRAFSELAAISDTETHEAILKKAINITATIQDEDDRSLAISALVPVLTTREHFDMCLSIVAGMQWSLAKSEALVAIAPHIPHDLVAEAEAIAKTIFNGPSRDRAIRATTRSIKVGYAHNEDDIAAALLAARTIGDTDDRLVALIALGRYLPDKQEQCFQLAKLASKKVLIEVLELSTPFALRKVLEFALGNTSLTDIDRMRLAFKMMAELPPSDMAELLPLISSIKNTQLRAKVLDCLPEPLRTLELDKLDHATEGMLSFTPMDEQPVPAKPEPLAPPTQTASAGEQADSASRSFRTLLDKSDKLLRRELLAEFPAQYPHLAKMPDSTTLLAVWRAIADTGEWLP